MSSAILGSRCTPISFNQQTLRTVAQSGGGVKDSNRVKVKDFSPQIFSVALLVVSAVLGSAIFGVIGALVAPLAGLFFLSVVSDGKCFEPEVTVVYRNTTKANLSEEAPTSRTWNASSLDSPEHQN